MKLRPAELGSTNAIVPLNILSKSKARLSPLLRPTDRAQLTIAMLADVLSALRKSAKISSVTVVSADKSATRIVRWFGANFVWEGRRRGLNKALRLAIRKSERRGCSAVLVIHADLPLVTPREIDSFLSKARGYPVALNPSRNGSGTNALLLKPPQIIQPTFGERSFRKHVSLANQKKVRYRVVRFRGISFDVDEPRDLRKLMRQRIQNETGRFLLAIRRRNHDSTKGERHLVYPSEFAR